ncbi:unnamed protein product [Allacma fusca]|uniref:Uncharacterized protein n=1 Tax=Allacma fusca TaxID=39272 RepID=A0A8J2K0P3_9HEXA|nr:unnamed protein product [Allacma fusca]
MWCSDGSFPWPSISSAAFAKEAFSSLPCPGSNSAKDMSMYMRHVHVNPYLDDMLLSKGLLGLVVMPNNPITPFPNYLPPRIYLIPKFFFA